MSLYYERVGEVIDGQTIVHGMRERLLIALGRPELECVMTFRDQLFVIGDQLG